MSQRHRNQDLAPAPRADIRAHAHNERHRVHSELHLVEEAVRHGLEPDDVEAYGAFPGDPLAGVAFQRHWEEAAFAAAGQSYCAPAQRVGDFLAHRSSEGPIESHLGHGDVRASYLPGVHLGSLDGCLPEFALEAIREALPHFTKTIPGFTMESALLTGVETRTSSPVRVPRDNTTLECLNTPGLYPAGEGAGYAGGILSAAIDGIKVAEQVALTCLETNGITPRRLQSPGERGESAYDPA